MKRPVARRHRPSNSRAGQRYRQAACAVLVATQLVGCMSLEDMAPPVDQHLIAMGSRSGIDPEALSRGREVYLTRCISCHGVEPVGRYSIDQWELIVPEMAGEAKLDATNTANLLAYLLTAHLAVQTPESRPTQPADAQDSGGAVGVALPQ